MAQDVWMGALQIALALVELTMADGAKVYVNPAYVSKVYPTKEAVEGGANKYVAKGAKCIVTTSDGKFMAVQEVCEFVRQKLERGR